MGGITPRVDGLPEESRGISVLRYLAILSAARDFGVSAADIERVVHVLQPFQTSPRDLADALADTLKPEWTA